MYLKYIIIVFKTFTAVTMFTRYAEKTRFLFKFRQKILSTTLIITSRDQATHNRN